MLDARHLNSNTKQSSESWPFEFQARKPAGANKTYKSAINLLYANEQAALENETINLSVFHLVMNFLPSFGNFTALKVFYTFSHNKFLFSSKISFRHEFLLV